MEVKICELQEIKYFYGEKTLKLIFLLVVVCMASFWIVEQSPIDPVRAYIGEMSIQPEQKAKLEEYWGVNTPAHEKFLNWAENLLKGDLGTSLIYRMPVTDVVRTVCSFSYSNGIFMAAIRSSGFYFRDYCRNEERNFN
ncbi:MAG: hypothetical protein R2741_00720 [Methanolobus sp.]